MRNRFTQAAAVAVTVAALALWVANVGAGRFGGWRELHRPAAPVTVPDGRPTYAAGCENVRADGPVWDALDGARHRVGMVDAVGDGSVWVFVDGVYVAWADDPAALVTACAPAALARAIEAAQP